MATLLNPFLRADDANGAPVSGGQLALFEAGTTTPVTTYSDRALTSAQAQPLLANAAGEFAQSFVASGIYKIRVSDADGVTLYENDNVRIADRPDDPVFLDDRDAIIADTTSYATGTIIFGMKDDSKYEVAASGATDHTDTRTDGQKLYNLRTRNAHTAALIASLVEGTVSTLEGINYKSVTGGVVMEDIGVTGVGPADLLVDARAYGIVGDGSVDDTAQVARAAASGLIVDFGTLTPKISAQITMSANTTFIGADPGACRFKPVTSLDYADSVLYSEADNVQVFDIGCDGARSGTAIGATGVGYFIHFKGGDSCRVNRCDAQEVTGSGFWWEDMTNSNFDHNTTKNTGKDGVTNDHGILISVSDTDVSAVGLDNVSVSFCTVENPRRKGIATATAGAKLRNLRICDNTTTGCSSGGIYVGGTGGLANPFYHEYCQFDRNVSIGDYLGVSISNLLGGSARDNEVSDTTGGNFGFFSAMKGTDLRGNQGNGSYVSGWNLADTVDVISNVIFTDFSALNVNTSGSADAPRLLLDGVTDSLIGNGVGDAGGATYDIVEYSPATDNTIFGVDHMGGGSSGTVLFLNASSTTTITYPKARELATTLTLVNGQNDNVVLDPKYEHFVINGPTAVYSITGFTNGVSSRSISISSNVGYTGTIKVNNASSDAANRIIPSGGVDQSFPLLATADLTWLADLQGGRWACR